MGIETKIMVPFKGSFNEVCDSVVEALKKRFKARIANIEIHEPRNPSKDVDSSHYYMVKYITFQLDYVHKSYESGKEEWSMYVWYQPNADKSCGDFVLFNIGAWGHNKEIAKTIVEQLGGFADFNDCDDINIDFACKQPKIK